MCESSFEKDSCPHTRTKMELTVYLTKKAIQHAERKVDQAIGCGMGKLPYMRPFYVRIIRLWVWNNDRVPNPEIPSPEHVHYGWERKDDEWAAYDYAVTTSTRGHHPAIEMRLCRQQGVPVIVDSVVKSDSSAQICATWLLKKTGTVRERFA
ncbi:hypothetical protein OS493_039699 [Desmophyllum pertusum]|uniref:Uncharacterized protein n=1 Tax=Desmophyllum pertusum TaxID=174260 RepID=A0A9W9Z693_9CNID|nr:hypothetical protein OS493_039699 [Desmophyllum pertusum]